MCCAGNTTHNNNVDFIQGLYNIIPLGRLIPVEFNAIDINSHRSRGNEQAYIYLRSVTNLFLFSRCVHTLSH